MTNLFSRFSIKAALIASALCIVAGQGAAFYLGVFSWPVAAASGAALLVLALGAVREAANAAVMRQGITCCEAVGRGDFESRIMARAPGDLGKLMLSTNDLIDRIDAFVREAEASMQFASQRKFFRRIIETGMMGAFLNASRTINAATQIMQDEAKAAQTIEGELATLVASAAAGDFSQRIDLAGKQGFHRNVSQSLNELVESVDRGLTEFGRVLQSLAESDLSRRIEGDFKGAFLELKTDTNRMVDCLSGIVRQIRDAAANVQTATAEITVAMDDLARRSESQAASLEETAAATQEITETVTQNADNAVQANDLAVAARSAAQAGGAVVSDAIETMSRISEFSESITKIADVIDDIAFQTSLLALNAGVEAARAGDSGRGFAVVAAEVRALSQRSSTASNEVKALIRSSVSEVQTGVERVNQAGAKLGEITAAIDRVGGIVEQISTAGREQSVGLGEVNGAVAQMDEMTQQNAALVEEVSAASESLKEQATILVDQVRVFQLSESGETPRSANVNGRLIAA